MKSGIELITEERKRQIEVKDWTADHDDTHVHGELRVNAAILCCKGTDAEVHDFGDHGYWELSKYPEIKRLVIAGALIAAEIDRLNRKSKNP